MLEFETKQDQIHKLLVQHQVDALLLQRVSSFAWATCGAAAYVNTAASDGAASLLITPAGKYVLTTNIEAVRLEKEEKLGEQGWKLRGDPWYAVPSAVAELARGLRLAADSTYPGAKDLSAEVTRLRANLLPVEGERFRQLGRLCAEAMDQTCRALKPGMTEYQIAGLLAEAAESRGAQAIVNLIATDERIFNYRHPLPTAKKLDRYAMLVLCGRRWGLVCSITRLVYFGRLPDEVRRKAEAVARIDATFIASTRPGRVHSQIFQRAVGEYTASGFADEWRLHHQGGPAGYEPREWIVTPETRDRVQTGQAYAWNPSITGAKSEDTVLVGAESNEVLTVIEGWPMLPVNVDGQTSARPAILEVS